MIVNGKKSSSLEFTEAVALGDGIFETLRSYNGRVFALDEHLHRLQIGLIDLGLPDFDLEQLRSGVGELLMIEDFEVGAVRISVYSDGNWAISHRAYAPPQEGLVCATKELSGPALRYKSASYGERLSLRRQANRAGFDDLILYNSNDEVMELSTSNLILHIDGAWKTPQLDTGALPGVTRHLLIHNFEISEIRLLREDLRRAKSVAAISSLREVQGIKAIDGKDFPISNQLRELQVSFHHWILGNLAL